MCKTDQGIYVDPAGNIFPCCWIGGDYLEYPIKEELDIHRLRNIAVNTTKEMLKVIGVPNCESGILHKDDVLWPLIEDYWKGKDKCLTCARQCSNLVYN
jgi:hypothetical protein